MNTPFKMKNSALAKFAKTAGSPIQKDKISKAQAEREKKLLEAQKKLDEERDKKIKK
tara:strand:- start:39 stop:209 length:171 start_codon:yes stop_codon:yes gene_type:complete